MFLMESGLESCLVGMFTSCVALGNLLHLSGLKCP